MLTDTFFLLHVYTCNCTSTPITVSSENSQSSAFRQKYHHLFKLTIEVLILKKIYITESY